MAGHADRIAAATAIDEYAAELREVAVETAEIDGVRVGVAQDINRSDAGTGGQDAIRVDAVDLDIPRRAGDGGVFRRTCSDRDVEVAAEVHDGEHGGRQPLFQPLQVQAPPAAPFFRQEDLLFIGTLRLAITPAFPRRETHETNPPPGESGRRRRYLLQFKP